MKPLHNKSIFLLSLILLLLAYQGFSQNAPKGDLSLAINYYTINNQVPYLLVRVKTKIDGRFQNVSGVTLSLFLDRDSTGTFIGKVTTDEKGEASTNIPPSLKNEWGKLTKHTFLAQFAGNKKYESAKADLTVAKAKIILTTSADKKVIATFYEMKDTTWTPVKGVDVKIGVARQASELSVNETAAFTTDSTGVASADFKRDSIPGDAKGNIVLVAKVEDNDSYGNLRIEKTVPWGAKFTAVNTFNERSLFATRDKTPFWLLFIAYSILIAVWGILISLMVSIFKIRKLGRQH